MSKSGHIIVMAIDLIAVLKSGEYFDRRGRGRRLSGVSMTGGVGLTLKTLVFWSSVERDRPRRPTSETWQHHLLNSLSRTSLLLSENFFLQLDHCDDSNIVIIMVDSAHYHKECFTSNSGNQHYNNQSQEYDHTRM